MSNDPRRPRRPRQNSGDPVSDIERFLKEVDRLRRKAADESPRPDERVQEAVPVEPTPRRRVPPPRPVPRPRPRPRFEEEPVPVLEVQPAERRVVREEPAFAAPPAAPEFAPSAPPPEVTFIGAAAKAPTVSRPRRSSVAIQIRSLLQGNNLRAAIMLREILDKPRCKRKR